jgi:hypothetical protein
MQKYCPYDFPDISMKPRLLSLVYALLAGITVTPVQAETPGRAADKARPAGNIRIEGEMLRLHLPASTAAMQPSRLALPRSSQEWLDQMLDSSRNGAAFKDPEAFVEWLDAITEPQFMTALATATIDPKTYPRALSSLIRPETARNWAEFTNPLLYLRWMITGANPDFYNAIIERLADPEKAKRWAQYTTSTHPLATPFKSGSTDYSGKPHAADSANLGASWQRLPATPAATTYRY